jgi:hypothetical protein
MAKQTVDIGSTANDGTGDSIRNGGDKINDNFTELFNALGNGTTIAANTGTLASNAYLIASYQSNTQISSRLNAFAQVANVAALAALANTNTAIAQRAQVANVVTLAALANTNSAIAKRAEVANVASLAALGNTNSRINLVNTNLTGSNTALRLLINDRVQVANVAPLSALGNTNSAIATQTARVTLVNTNLTGTNTAIRTLVADRTQVANVYAIVHSGKSYSTVPNYGAAVTYDISANGSSAYIVSNMGFGKGGAAFNNPELTVRNESTVAFDLNGLAGAHPFYIRSGASGTNYFSNTLIHVAVDGTISTGASAQGKNTGVLYWQIPHDIVSSGRDSYTYVCASHPSNMKGNVHVKDTGAI